MDDKAASVRRMDDRHNSPSSSRRRRLPSRLQQEQDSSATYNTSSLLSGLCIHLMNCSSVDTRSTMTRTWHSGTSSSDAETTEICEARRRALNDSGKSNQMVLATASYGGSTKDGDPSSSRKATAAAKPAGRRRHDTAASTAAAQFINEQLIPKNRNELKQSTLYQNTYKLLQFQRDQYLVGTDYANWRVKERSRHSDRTRDVTSFQHDIVYEETTLGHVQIASVLSGFVPSPTVRTALLPVITPLPGGPLYDPAQRAMVGLIQGQNRTLNAILKNQILQFLKNPQNRKDIKDSTKGYISNTTTTYRDV